MKTKQREPYRQGDIYLVPVEEIPTDLEEVPRQGGKIVLAEGEATGHLHEIDSPAATFLAADVEDIEDIEDRFLKVEAGVELTHPEHGTIDIAPGSYEVRRQREYDQAGGIVLVGD